MIVVWFRQMIACAAGWTPMKAVNKCRVTTLTGSGDYTHEGTWFGQPRQK